MEIFLKKSENFAKERNLKDETWLYVNNFFKETSNFEKKLQILLKKCEIFLKNTTFSIEIF